MRRPGEGAGEAGRLLVRWRDFSSITGPAGTSPWRRDGQDRRRRGLLPIIQAAQDSGHCIEYLKHLCIHTSASTRMPAHFRARLEPMKTTSPSSSQQSHGIQNPMLATHRRPRSSSPTIHTQQSYTWSIWQDQKIEPDHRLFAHHLPTGPPIAFIRLYNPHAHRSHRPNEPTRNFPTLLALCTHHYDRARHPAHAGTHTPSTSVWTFVYGIRMRACSRRAGKSLGFRAVSRKRRGCHGVRCSLLVARRGV